MFEREFSWVYNTQVFGFLVNERYDRTQTPVVRVFKGLTRRMFEVSPLVKDLSSGLVQAPTTVGLPWAKWLGTGQVGPGPLLVRQWVFGQSG